MGLLKDLIGAAAPVVGGIFGGPAGSAIGGLIGGAVSSSGQPKSTSSTTQQQLDPRMQAMLFGDNGNNGLLNRYQGLLDKGPSAAANQYASDSGNYLSQYGGQDMNAARDAAYKAMGGNAAPNVQATGTGAGLNAYASGNMVQAPGQNNIDLTGSYDRFINGTPGANPYLDQSIDGAIAQNRLGFNQLQGDATENLMKNVMPSIRSNSVLAGQYGGSRQGIAEGNAIGQLGKEMARATSMFGQNATNAAVGAKANAYETDSNRALSATQGLGAQQYGVASQDAQTKNQAEFMNVGNTYDLGKFNAGLAQNNNQFNAGLQQQGQLTTNAQNNGSLLAGAGLLGGLTGQASATVNQSDNADLARAQGVNGLLAPYMSVNGSQTTSQPLYQNTGANMLGGALTGLGLYNQFAGSGNSSTEKRGTFSDLSSLFGKDSYF
ncbi:MAG TPA: hypothetical protein VGE47_08410 [Burkholderiaceae bacterium]